MRLEIWISRRQTYGIGTGISKLLLFDKVAFACFNKLLLLGIARPENGDFQFLGRIGPQAKVKREGILIAFARAAIDVAGEDLLAHFQPDCGADGCTVDLARSLQLHSQPFI